MGEHLVEATSKAVRAALYLRVSTSEQHPDNQVPELERYAGARGWRVIDRYVDHGVSGVSAQRPGLDRLLEDARRRRFDAVLFWSVSRVGRNMEHAVLVMFELLNLGVRVVVVTSGLDSDGPFGRSLFSLFAELAEMNLEERRARIRAGLQRVRAAGVRLGRPPGPEVPLEEARQLLAEGHSLRAVSRRLGVSKSTLHRRLVRDREAVSQKPPPEAGPNPLKEHGDE